VNKKEYLEQAANERANQERYEKFLKESRNIDVSQISVTANTQITGQQIRRPESADGELFARIQLAEGSFGLEANNFYLGPYRARPTRLGFSDDDPNRWEVYSWVEVLAKLYQGQPHIAAEHDLVLHPAIVRRITPIGFEDRVCGNPIRPVFPTPGVGQLNAPPTTARVKQAVTPVESERSEEESVKKSAEAVAGVAQEFDTDGPSIDDASESKLVADILKQPRQKQLRQTLATLDEQQFNAIRLPHNHDVVIQGGPGTGKSLVAAKRVAYLLHEDAGAAGLGDGRVMLAGPSRAYVHHVQRILRELHVPTDRFILTSIEDIFSDLLGDTGLRSFTPNRRPTSSRAANKELYEVCGFVAEAFEGWYENTYIESLQSQRGSQPSKPPLKDLTLGKKVMACYEFLRMQEESRPVIELCLRATNTDHDSTAEEIDFNVTNRAKAWVEWFQSLPASSNINADPDVQWLVAMLAWYLKPSDGIQRFANVKHVIVDEAQDLQPVEWEFLSTMNGGHWTVIGDVNQNSIGDKRQIDKWRAVCRQLDIPFNLMVLDRGYRSTSGISQLAEAVIGNAAPRSQSMLIDNECPSLVKTTLNRLAYEAVAEAMKNVTSFPDGQNAIILPPSFVDVFQEALNRAAWRQQEDPLTWVVNSNGLAKQIAVATPVQVRGLEFDSVVLIQPGDFDDANQLYMGITRAHRKLSIVHSKGFPPKMHNALLKCM
jgi:DNA helicase II / ATP-dependent DNA helicase PcrA